MIPISIIEQQFDYVAERLATRNLPELQQQLNRLLELDQQRKQIIRAVETQRAEMNQISKQVGIEMAKGNTEAAEQAKANTQQIKGSISQMEQELELVMVQRDAILIEFPNIPHPSVPKGKSAADNSIVQEKGQIPVLPENALPHWELAKKHKLIDWELGVKITGAGFPVYMNQGARLQRALIQFFLEQARLNGYQEIMPPLLVNKESGYGTGQLPDKEGQMYHATLDDLYLIPTAEVPITNLFRDVIVEEEDLPLKFCGYTPCFRREAGSYGKEVRGLNRLHQFDKVEIVQLVHPDHSYNTLEEMLAYVQGLLDKLELPYRTALLCSGDMGFTSAKTYDMEVYSAAQGLWLEVSSISNFEGFQANRMKLRYKSKADKKNYLAHTLNGSALALPRIVASLLENHQQADGRIRVPTALVPFTGFEYIGS
jgi:seryl-tRNA synthetase